MTVSEIGTSFADLSLAVPVLGSLRCVLADDRGALGRLPVGPLRQSGLPGLHHRVPFPVGRRQGLRQRPLPAARVDRPVDLPVPDRRRPASDRGGSLPRAALRGPRDPPGDPARATADPAGGRARPRRGEPAAGAHADLRRHGLPPLARTFAIERYEIAGEMVAGVLVIALLQHLLPARPAMPAACAVAALTIGLTRPADRWHRAWADPFRISLPEQLRRPAAYLLVVHPRSSVRSTCATSRVARAMRPYRVRTINGCS